MILVASFYPAPSGFVCFLKNYFNPLENPTNKLHCNGNTAGRGLHLKIEQSKEITFKYKEFACQQMCQCCQWCVDRDLNGRLKKFVKFKDSNTNYKSHFRCANSLLTEEPEESKLLCPQDTICIPTFLQSYFPTDR